MRYALVLASILLVAGCSTSPSAKSPDAAKAPAAQAPAPKPSPGASVQPPDLQVKSEPEADSDPTTYVTDPKTGERLQRVPKTAPGYYAEKGVVRHGLLNPALFSVPIVSEDAEAWYVTAPRVETRTPEELEAFRKKKEKATVAPPELPAEEFEEVRPPVSKIRLRFLENSKGLPTAGFWRQNFAVADIDGDGQLEVVTPPPRLAMGEPRGFKLKDGAWTSLPLEFQVPEGADFENGGVSAADMDGDGKVDLVVVGHGQFGGPMIAYNLGGLKFRVERRKLPKSIGSRSVAIGDLDGDGRLDLVTISDSPEFPKREEVAINPRAMDQAEPGLDSGYDIRSFMQGADGTFSENHVGLLGACFGYAIELWPSPPDGGEPFFASDCRYRARTMVIYGFDREAKSFHRVGLDFAEDWALHTGVGLGLYKGLPAAFMGYTKSGPNDLPKKLDGGGVSVYYREDGQWKRKRIVKVLDPFSALSQGIGVGDLDGNGLDDVVWADDTSHRLRIFLQQPDGGFEEIDQALEPTFVNHSTCVRVADIDGDGKKDIVLMYETGTGLKTRAGGLRYFQNLGPEKK